MNIFHNTALKISAEARKKRSRLFKTYFEVDENTRILDLGSENGANIFNVLQGTNFAPDNVYIADIDPVVEEGAKLFGFQPVLIDESGKIPFEDKFFDIVYSSSVIEHVTINKSDIWKIKNGRHFKKSAFERQKKFAGEIRRLGERYFVQTPNRNFFIESHSWLPFIGYAPREILVPALKISNKFWVKKTVPDFNLLNAREMKILFPEAEIVFEKKFGFVKSIMAIKSRI